VDCGPSSSLWLGHNRLSIIDLSDRANQPMWDAEHRFVIVYNGEIYNYVELRDELRGLGHRFATESDTEVILEAFKAWGPDALTRLNGMFAFALVEPAAGRLWLARDRFGVKPLYFRQEPHQLIFASTPGPIAQEHALSPDLQYVARGLHFWVYEDDGDSAPFEGMAAVPAGHMVAVDWTSGNSIRINVKRHYDFSSQVRDRREAIRGRSTDDLLAEMMWLLEDAVRVRLRADVPIGISLSGGLDSSSLAMMVAEQHGAVIGFSYGRPDQLTSEGPIAASVGQRAGIESHWVWPDDREVVSAFWEALDAQDAPFPNLSIVAQYLVFRGARERGVKVLLGGQGADEVLMGYRKFQLILLTDALRRHDPRAVLRFGTGLARLLLEQGVRPAFWHRKRYSRRGGLPTQLRLPRSAGPDLELASAQSGIGRQVLDVTRLSLPTLLRYEDRNSAGNGLETRLPYLDYRFAEFAVALPDELKVRAGYGKWLLRAGMRERLPATIHAARSKRGFDVPQRGWVEAGVGAAIRSRLREERRAREWLSPDVRIAEAFSDRRLATDPAAVGEATSLLWLTTWSP